MEIIDEMNLYSYLSKNRDLDTLKLERESAKKLLMEIKPKLIEKYSSEILDYYKDEKKILGPNLGSDDNFIDIFLLLKGDLKGKKILDLGCGSSYSEDHKVVKCFDYSPWLCRLLNETEVIPIGIDIESNKKEEFKSYVCDLYKEDSLDFFPSNSIDVVTTNALLDSPKLEKKYGRGAGITLLNRLIPQLNKIVKPQGIFICPNYSVEILKQSEKRRVK